MTMRPLHALPLLLLVVCVLAACHSAVRFSAHAPYNSPRRINQPLLIVHPDEVDIMRETASVGGFLRPRKFRVHYGEALKWEAVARFGNMFTGVFLVSASDYASLLEREDEELMDVYAVPQSLLEGRGYVLDMSRIRFDMEGGRPRYLIEVSFTNRSTGVELFRGLMRGSGQSITVRESTDLMITELNRAVISATTSVLTQLATRVLRAIDEEPPPPPRETAVEAVAAPEESTPQPDAPEQEEQEPPHPRLRPFFVTPE